MMGQFWPSQEVRAITSLLIQQTFIIRWFLILIMTYYVTQEWKQLTLWRFVNLKRVHKFGNAHDKHIFQWWQYLEKFRPKRWTSLSGTFLIRYLKIFSVKVVWVLIRDHVKITTRLKLYFTLKFDFICIQNKDKIIFVRILSIPKTKSCHLKSIWSLL